MKPEHRILFNALRGHLLGLGKRQLRATVRKSWGWASEHCATMAEAGLLRMVDSTALLTSAAYPRPKVEHRYLRILEAIGAGEPPPEGTLEADLGHLILHNFLDANICLTQLTLSLYRCDQ